MKAFLCLAVVLSTAGPCWLSAVASSPPCSLTIRATAGGAFAQTGERVDGYYLVGNTPVDYFGGGPKIYRNWLLFKLPNFPGPLVGAELRLSSGTTVSDLGSETWELHHVSTATTNLLFPPRVIGSNQIPVIPPAPLIYEDLGDGAVYGSVTIRTNQNPRAYYDPGAQIFVPLSADALAALTAAQGTNFAMGGSVTSLDSNTNSSDVVFLNTYVTTWPIELILNFGSGAPAVDPVLVRGGSSTLRGDPTTEVFAEDALVLASEACGQTPLALQWLRNGEPLPGETNSAIYKSLVTPNASGAYQLQASNAAGVAVSAPVNVAITALRITTDLTPQTVFEQDYAGLAIFVASFPPVTLEWRKDGVLLPNQTYYFLNLQVSPADAGDYQVIARNAYGSVTSAVAHLTVQLRPPQIFNDLNDGITAAGLSFGLSVSASGHQPIFYQWFKNGVPLPGQTNALFSVASAQFSDAGNYFVTLSNAAGVATSRTAHVTVQAFISVFGPFDTSVYWGAPTSLYISVYAAAPIFYRWYFNGTLLPAETNSSVFIPQVTPSQEGQYFVVVSNAFGVLTSQVARVTAIRQAPNVWAYLNQYEPSPSLQLPQIALGTRVVFVASVFAGPPASLQWRRNGIDLPGATNALLELTSVTLADTGQYTMVAANIYGTNASAPILIEIVPLPPSADIYGHDYLIQPSIKFPQLAAGTFVRFFSTVHGSPPLSLQWQHNGIALPGESATVLALNNLSSNDSGAYALVATNLFGAATSAPVVVEVVSAAPFFVIEPAESEAVAGGTVAFQSAAGGSRPISYQWRFQGVDLPDQTNAALLLSSVTAAQAGAYEVVARNAGGEARHTNHLEVLPADALDHWQWRLPQPQGSRLRSVTWGNGRYVAVGRAGNILTSSNGLDWTSVLINANATLTLVAWGNGRFVATGYIETRVEYGEFFGYDPVYPVGLVGYVITSTDGVNWTPGVAPDQDYFGDLTFGNGTFVACGTQNRTWVYTSIDGLRWTPRRNEAFAAYRIAWGNGIFLANGGPGFYSSVDGVNWSLAGAADFGFNSLTFGNGLFVGVNSYVFGNPPYVAAVRTSTNGAVWDLHVVTNTPYLTAVAAGAGQVVAISPVAKATVVASSDLEHWETVDTGANQELEAVLYADGGFIAVGEAGTVARSTDGLAWSLLPVANDIDYYGLASNGNLMVAAGDDGTIQTSVDGRTWTRRSTPSGRNLHAAAYGNGLFLAAGRGGLILTSPDGITWTRRTSGVTNYLERALYANGRWVAVAEQGDLCTSTDGLSWTPVSTGAPLSDHEGVAYGKGRWVIAGGYFGHDEGETFAVTALYTSTDAMNWSRVGFNVGVRLRDVTFARNLFVAVGNDGVVATSANGLDWNHHTVPRLREGDNLRRVHYADGRFVIVGNDGHIFSSSNPEDPSAWHEHLSHTSQNLHDIIASADGTFFVAVGNNGMLLQSVDPRARVTKLRLVAEGVEIQFNPGSVPGPMRIEASVDLKTWETVANDATSPIVIPSASTNARFFRLAAP